MSKDLRGRYQCALDLKLDLADAQGDREAAETGEAETAGPSWTRAAVTIAVALGVGIGGYLLGSGRSRAPANLAPRLTNPRQLTASGGVEVYPTWSPDGSRIAYAASPTHQGNASDVWVVQAGGGPPVNLTADHDGFDGHPSWSPDGNQIAFTSSRDGGGCFTMPALGGPARKIIQEGHRASGPAWTPDGNELACIVGNPWAIRMTDLQSGAFRDIELGPLPGSPGHLSSSPDGRLFAFIAHTSPAAPITHVLVIPSEGGEPIRLTDGMTGAWGPSFRGRDEVCYVSNRAGAMDLWCQKLQPNGHPMGGPQAVTVGIGLHRRAVFSHASDRLAYSRGGLVAHLWRVPILDDRPATWFDAQQLTFEDAYMEYVDVSYDGALVAFDSDRAGNQDIWIMASDGSQAARQVSTDPTPEMAPAWSPDGSEIAFYSIRSGQDINRDIYVAPVEAGPVRHLVDHPGQQFGPRWSPDGEAVIYWGAGVSVVPASGGEPRNIAPSGVFPDWSRDGTSILFGSFDGPLSITSPEATTVEEVLNRIAGMARWSLDGTVIYYFPHELDDILSFRLADGSTTPMTELRGRPGQLGNLGLATDGEYLYFTWRQDVGDIWVMDVVTDEDD